MDANVQNENAQSSEELPPTFAEIELLPEWARPWVLRRLVEQTVERGASVWKLSQSAPEWARLIIDQVLFGETVGV